MRRCFLALTALYFYRVLNKKSFRDIWWPQKRPKFIKDSEENLFLLGLLGQEHSLDVRQNTTLGDGYTAEELVKFLIVTDSQLEVTRDDPCLLIVTSGVTGQLENLSS